MKGQVRDVPFRLALQRGIEIVGRWHGWSRHPNRPGGAFISAFHDFLEMCKRCATCA